MNTGHLLEPRAGIEDTTNTVNSIGRREAGSIRLKSSTMLKKKDILQFEVLRLVLWQRNIHHNGL